MAWDDSAIISVRALLGDESDVLPDSQIRRLLVVSAPFVLQEIRTSSTYTVNIEDETIEPDPSSEQHLMNLIILKAVHNIVMTQYKLYSKNALRVSDGLSQVDSTQAAMYFKGLAEEYKNVYEKAKMISYMNFNSGHAIITPITVPFLTPERFN